MSTIEAIGVVGTLASIAGLIYAIYYARNSRRVKLLLYDTSWSVPLATARSPEEDYTLSVLFQRKGQGEERVSSAHVTFLRFANLGKEPIRGTDIAPTNPVRVTVKECRVLDISLAGASRSVANVSVSGVVLDKKESHADILFDFLDYQDGGVVKILTEGAIRKVALTGDIIGMPSGIRRCDEIRSLGILNKLGWALGAVFLISALAVSVLAFQWITGSWQNVWVLCLPFIALILPAVIIAIVASTIWPEQEVSLPQSLSLPKWFHSLSYYRILRHIPEGPMVKPTGLLKIDVTLEERSSGMPPSFPAEKGSSRSIEEKQK